MSTVESGITAKSGIRFRTVALVIGIIAAFLLTYVTDPTTEVLFKIPMGVSTILLIKSLVYYSLAAGVIHLGSKAMFDYIDRAKLIERAIKDGQAGSVFIGLAIFVLAYALVFSSLISLSL